MSARYILREGSPGGERILDDDDVDTDRLLRRRDEMRDVAPRHSRVYDVIDTDATDPPESGILDRCPGCGAVVLASRIEL